LIGNKNVLIDELVFDRVDDLFILLVDSLFVMI